MGSALAITLSQTVFNVCSAFQLARLHLGFKKEYVLVNAATGLTTEVFPTGRSGLPNILPVPPTPAPGPGPGPGGRGGGGRQGGNRKQPLDR